ncbi:MAG: hypothetical protein KC502_22850 [Myxococcales bacterium]|nr:hypothetical protein [Myxococcales bacterium]
MNPTYLRYHRRRCHRIAVLALLTSAFTFTGHNVAAATETHAAHDAHRHTLATKVIGLRSVSGGSTTTFLGQGVVVEREFDHFELELSWASLHASEGSIVPIDLLVKLPVHVGPHVDLFVGLGPSVHLRPGHAAAAGAIASTGSWFWFSPHVGMLLEFDYAIVNDRTTTHEIEAAMGVAVRFP